MDFLHALVEVNFLGNEWYKLSFLLRESTNFFFASISILLSLCLLIRSTSAVAVLSFYAEQMVRVDRQSWCIAQIQIGPKHRISVSGVHPCVYFLG